MQSYLIGALLFIVAMVIFVLQNPQPVTITFITWVSPEISLALVILLAACAGAVITFLVDSFRHLRNMQKLRDQRARKKKQKQIKDSAEV